MTDVPLVSQPKFPVSVVHDVADGGEVFRGEWDRVVSDRSVNCAVSGNCCPAQGIGRGLPGNRGSRWRL